MVGVTVLVSVKGAEKWIAALDRMEVEWAVGPDGT